MQLDKLRQRISYRHQDGSDLENESLNFSEIHKINFATGLFSGGWFGPVKNFTRLVTLDLEEYH